MFFRGFLYGLVFLLCLVMFAKVRSRVLRQAVLLVASYALYATWGAWFTAVLVASTVLNFLLGNWLRRKPSPSILGLGIFLNVALLSIFKYLPTIAVSSPLPSL